MRQTLNQASTQSEYNALLELESRDLLIRELRHRCARLIQGFLSGSHPPIIHQEPNALSSLQSELIYFFNDNREALEEEFPLVLDVRDLDRGVSLFRAPDMAAVDRAEIENLQKVFKDLERHRTASYSFYRFSKEYLE